jgi:hypothetical protein
MVTVLRTKPWKSVALAQWGGIVLGAIFGMLNLIERAGQAGAQVDLTPIVATLAATGGIAAYLLRTLAKAGEHAGKTLADAWDKALKSADPAKELVAASLDGPEAAFYSGLGASRPSRLILNAFGPGVAIGLMALIALVVAPLVYFLFSSFSASNTGAAIQTVTFPREISYLATRRPRHYAIS